MIVLSMIVFILAFIMLVFAVSASDEFIAGISTILFVLSWILVVACYKFKPQAIDVYQGKTTLEITYRDNIPVDSIVVFKR